MRGRKKKSKIKKDREQKASTVKIDRDRERGDRHRDTREVKETEREKGARIKINKKRIHR